MILVYDGTFESFLTLVYDVYYKKLKPVEITKNQPTNLFEDDIFYINFDETKSFKVLQSLQEKFPKKYFENILHLFMCDTVAFEIQLLEYIIIGFKDTRQLENINLDCVFFINKLLKELFRLNHKMTGFTRFQELEDGSLYATIDTKFNVVYFLGKHFSKRLNNQNYIIHDLKRKIAFIHNQYFVGVQEVAEFEQPIVSSSEQKFQTLWKTFFDAVAIESRSNDKLQKQMVPLIYRIYMNEFA